MVVAILLVLAPVLMIGHGAVAALASLAAAGVLLYRRV
jgi:hypothetical protein